MKLRQIALALPALGAFYATLPYAAAPAAAQHYYYNASCNCSHGGWGGSAIALGSGYGRPMLLQGPAESMALGSAGPMQNDPMQTSIRNALAGQAQSRAGYINSQQQSTQDWYFQQQALAMAQRRAAQYAKAQNAKAAARDKATAKSDSAASEPNPTMPPNSPPANHSDLIQWPVALQGEYYWSERKMIEDPYLRTPPKLSAPNVVDYRNMAKAVDNMKDILDRRVDEGMERREYDEAKGFLLKLEQEVSARIRPADGAN